VTHRIDRRGFLVGAGSLTLSTLLDVEASAAKMALPFPELRATGSAGAIGVAHGRRFAKQVEHNVGFYLKWLAQAITLPEKRALEIAAHFRPVMREHTPALLEEIDGIARGSKRKRDEILLVNARTDMLVMGRQPSKDKHAAIPALGAVPGCTALAMTGHDPRKRRLLALGQNWDWRPALANNTIILRVKRRGAPRVVTFTEAGMVGKIGFNQHRLGVCLNFLSHKSEDPRRAFGVPVHVLLRAVMEARSLEEAFKLVAWAPRCASANFLMAQHGKKGPRALDLEWTPSAVGRVPMKGAALVHTNHYLDHALVAGCDSGFGRSTMNRFKMASKMATALQREQSDPSARMIAVLKNRAGAPYSVSKTATKKSRSQTLAGVVMDLSRNRLHLCAGQPHAGEFIRRPGA